MIFSLAKPCADDMDDQEAFEGDDFTFQIDCDGNPKPVAKWTKEGKGIDTKDGHFTIAQADPNAYRLIIKGIQHCKHLLVFPQFFLLMNGKSIV